MVGSPVSSRLTVDPVRIAGNYADPIVVDPLRGWVKRAARFAGRWLFPAARAYLCVDSAAEFVSRPSVKRGAEALVLCWP